MNMLKNVTLAALLTLSLSVAASAQDMQDDLPSEQIGTPQEEFFTAKVIKILSEQNQNDYGIHRKVQQVRLRITSGSEKGKEFETENGVLDGREDTILREGESVVVDKQTRSDGETSYLITEKYRLPSMMWVVAFFLVLTLLFGGITGITSIVGLAVSVLILLWFVIPRIVAGSDPLIVSLIGCVLIACTSLYLAHGFNRRTSIALLSTCVTLAFAAAMDIAFVHVTQLFGMGSDESLYLQTGLLQHVNLKGLLLGGILIGCLGVLDDVTTAQTAAIDEISKANPKLTTAELSRAGKSVGKEHIASLINTLALAYVGASLPLLLLLSTNENNYPFWVTINGEFFADEIIRTVVGSATLLVAVPISTWFAAYFLQGGKGPSGPSGHSHGHSHSVWVS